VLLAFACDNWKTIHINEKGFAVSYRKWRIINLFVCQQSIWHVLTSKSLHSAHHIIVQSSLHYSSGYSLTSSVMKHVEKWVLNSDRRDSVPFKEISQKHFLHKTYTTQAMYLINMAREPVWRWGRIPSPWPCES
jgi:hypothetical protein